MTIRIEVTGGTAADVAQELMSFALLMAPRLREHMTAAPVATEGLGEMAAAEAAADVPVDQPVEKKRGRKTKSEEQKDVRRDDAPAADSVAVGSASGAEPAVPGGAVRTGDQQKAEDDKPAEVDAVAEVEPVEEPALTVDQLQNYVVKEYLMLVTKDQEVRTATYRALLDKFGIGKLREAAPDQIGPIKAYVDGEIARHNAGRKAA